MKLKAILASQEMSGKRFTDKQRENSDARARRLANLKPFPKGVSGNPAVRPKSITLSEALRRELATTAAA